MEDGELRNHDETMKEAEDDVNEVGVGSEHVQRRSGLFGDVPTVRLPPEMLENIRVGSEPETTEPDRLIECGALHVQRRSGNYEDVPIVWPPVVVLENTRVGYDHATKRIRGLDNNEIRMFVRGLKKDIEFNRVLCLYGPRGHRGRTLITFAPTYLGFMEAEDLHELLQRSNRGRDMFMRVRPRDANPWAIGGWDTPDLVSDDGKRIIYGYLAQPRDMEEIDRDRRVLKRWTVESKMEKVLKPHDNAQREREEQKLRLKMLEEQKKEIALTLETEATDLGRLTEELEQKRLDILSRKGLEEKVQREHETLLAQRKKQHEAEKENVILQYRQTESRIREALERNKEMWEAENAMETQACELLREQKEDLSRKRQAEQRQLAAMKNVNFHYELRVRMETALAKLAEQQNKRKVELQEKQNRELMHLKDQQQKEKELLLEETLAKQEKMKQDVEQAKRESEQANADPSNKCSVCDKVFEPTRQRALYTCGHVNVCYPCSLDLWNAKVRQCVTCERPQKVKPKAIHHQAYT